MISAVILTKNEEKRIVDCLESLSWCDEIIVVDDNSGDRTVDIVKNKNIAVYTRSLDNDYASQRNFGLEKTGGDWVLFVDADERISSALQKEIKKITITSSYNGFKIKRVDVVWGKPLLHGETGNIYLLRLARKVAGRWEGSVHEEWKIKAPVGTLENEIMHYPFEYYREFLAKINFYTTLRAQELYDKGVKSNYLSIVLYTKLKFLYNYFVKLGILDGTSGFIHAITMSMHSFLVRSKLWLLWNKK